jgi:hypothetical protein
MIPDNQDIAFVVYDTLGDALTSLARLPPSIEADGAVVAISALRRAMWDEFQDRSWIVDYLRSKEGFPHQPMGGH